MTNKQKCELTARDWHSIQAEKPKVGWWVVVCATIGRLAQTPALVYWTEKAGETCLTQVPDLHWIRVPNPSHGKSWRGERR